MLVVHPWAQFLTGMLIGCWIGAIIATAGILLLLGKRVRQLENVNFLLRTRLKARLKPLRTGTGGSGSMLVMPHPDSARHSGSIGGRIARVN